MPLKGHKKMNILVKVTVQKHLLKKELKGTYNYHHLQKKRKISIKVRALSYRQIYQNLLIILLNLSYRSRAGTYLESGKK